MNWPINGSEQVRLPVADPIDRQPRNSDFRRIRNGNTFVSAKEALRKLMPPIFKDLDLSMPAPAPGAHAKPDQVLPTARDRLHMIDSSEAPGYRMTPAASSLPVPKSSRMNTPSALSMT